VDTGSGRRDSRSRSRYPVVECNENEAADGVSSWWLESRKEGVMDVWKGKRREEEKGLNPPRAETRAATLPGALEHPIGLELANPAYPMHIACI
jgi:hypothetical protein